MRVLSIQANYYPDQQQKLYEGIGRAIDLFYLEEEDPFELCAYWKCSQLVTKFQDIVGAISYSITFLNKQELRLTLIKKLAITIKKKLFLDKCIKSIDQPLSLWQDFCQNSDKCDSYTLLLIYHLDPKDVNQVQRDLPLGVPCFFALAKVSFMAYDALSVILPNIKDVNIKDKGEKDFIYYLSFRSIFKAINFKWYG